MTRFAKVLTDDQAQEAAAYFSSLTPKRWTRVVETETCQKPISRDPPPSV